MRKLSIKILATVLFLLSFTASSHAATILKVGASSSPHAEILQFVKPILAKKGINLKIIIFQDYILPNKALAKHDIDANYYQHIAFLNKQMQDFGYKFVNLGKIHIEPMGLYSKEFKSLKDVKDGTTVLMSNSIADRARFLSILEQAKLIKLRIFKNDIEKANADFKDIVENPKKLKFKANVQPSLMPSAYLNNAAGLIFINTNYAIASKINPEKEALFLEQGKASLYSNILVAREDNANNPDLKTLLQVLRSKAVKAFILKKYNGLVVTLN